MAHPFPSLRRTTRALITAAFLWLLSCWAWTIHHLIVLSHPPITPLLTNNHNDLHGDRLTTAKGMRQLDQITANIRGAASSTGLRATDSPAATLSHAAIDDPPPMTSLIFPLHARSGTHHVYMYIGSPPQRQTLIVDTGSRLTAFPCSPHCTECGMHASRQFDVNQSSSLSFVPCGECVLSRRDFELEAYFKGDGVGGNSGDGDVNVNLIPNGLRGTDGHKTEMKRKSCSKSHCEIHQRYTEGSSWNAFEVKDNVWLGFEDVNKSNLQHIEHSRPFVFGCQTSEEGLFQNQYADGIMGLSMYTQTLVGSLHEQGSVQHESFSLCFNSKGGHIALGGISSGNGLAQQNDHGIKHLSPMQFIPLARENTWYYTVHVTSISVGEHVLPSDTFQYLNDHKGTIVDSGTTDTFLSHKIAKAFTIAWAKIVRRKYTNHLQQYTYDQFMSLPIITFEFDGGAKWDVRPEAYMEASKEDLMTGAPWQGKHGFTSRIYVDEPHGAVLGANMMMGHDVYFDAVNRRIGVARSECAF